MISLEWLLPYLVSNALAVLLLILAFKQPRVTRWACVLIFLGAAAVNGRLAIIRPLEYLDYGALTPFEPYREFIHGWFSQHVQALILPIAVGQLVIAVLLTRRRPWRRAGIAGAIVFLSAIAPLGVGSAFPFSILLTAALLVMEWQLSRRGTPATGISPVGLSPSPETPITYSA